MSMLIESVAPVSTEESMADVPVPVDEVVPDVPVSTDESTTLTPVTRVKSVWHQHKKWIQATYRDMNATEQLILAKKSYTPVNGRKQSPSVVHRQAYVLRHPDHGLTGAALTDAIRADLMMRI